MWFKNLQLYRLPEKFSLSPEELHEKLMNHASKPCRGLDTHTLGWDKPLGREGHLLTHAVNGCIMVCARKEERVLPNAVVRDILDEKVAEIEDTESRTVRRKEKNELKDEIFTDLLPRAFTRSNRTYAYIDTEQDWMIVDSVSAIKAEEILSLMRDSLGSFEAKPFEVNQAPSAILTSWLNAQTADQFDVQDECELRDLGEEGGIVRLRRHGLSGTEIEAHLKAGKIVVKLAVSWNDRIACVLCEDVSVKRLKLLDVIQEQAADIEADTVAERFDADFSLMSLEMRNFITHLVVVYGGLASS